MNQQQPQARPGEIDYTHDPVVTIAIQLDEIAHPSPAPKS